MNSDVQFDNILVFAPPWGLIKHRPHHLMRAIIKSSRGKVLYIEDTAMGAYRAWLRFWSIVRKVEPRLFVMKSFKLIPYQSKISWAPRINMRIFAFAVRLVSKIMGLRNVVLWHWSCQSHEYTGMLGEKLVVYDSVCETSLFSWTTPEIRAMERELLRKSDLAFAATEPLRQIAAVDNPDTYLVSQAVDWDYFEKASEKTGGKPAELASLKGPIIGFTGNIHEWLDGTTLRVCAQKKPEWQIILIGPVRNIGETQKEIAKIRDLDNVHLLGAKPYDQLPRYVAWFDVCIIPYRLNKTTLVSETVKFYEYLATGKPIVSTALPPLKRWSDVVYLADSPEEFIECIEKALQEPPSSAARRRQLARENTWDARAQTAIKLIQDAWVRKYGPSPSEKSRHARLP